MMNLIRARINTPKWHTLGLRVHIKPANGRQACRIVVATTDGITLEFQPSQAIELANTIADALEEAQL